MAHTPRRLRTRSAGTCSPGCAERAPSPRRHSARPGRKRCAGAPPCRQLWERVDLLALPTLLGFPPTLDKSREMVRIRGLTSPVNLAGVPALALPVPTGGPLPASIQLIGPAGGEESLLAAGAILEQAVLGSPGALALPAR